MVYFPEKVARVWQVLMWKADIGHFITNQKGFVP